MSVNIRTLSKEITEEDVLISELVDICLAEERSMKIEAGSEGEDEFGGMEQIFIMGRKVKTYKPIKSSGQSGLRSCAFSDKYLGYCENRKKELRRELRNPPTFRNLRIYPTQNGYKIGVTFERLGKKRRLEVNVSNLSLRSIEQLLQNELSKACLGIPYSDAVIVSIQKYFEENVYSRLEKS